MSIAQQPAMQRRRPQARRAAPLQLAPERRPARSLAKIAGLVALSSLGLAVSAGIVGVALLMFAATVS